MKWKSGTSGNPRGRPPKGQSLAELLRSEGSRPCDGERTPATKKEALVAGLYDLALKGNLGAARLILEYCEGKPAPVQVHIENAPCKTYVLVSPDDWPDP